MQQSLIPKKAKFSFNSGLLIKLILLIDRLILIQPSWETQTIELDNAFQILFPI